MKPPKPIKKRSERGKLRKELGKLQFEYLVKKRGNYCELSGRPANGLGRFHILSVGAHPKLEFFDQNVLLCNWLPHHYNWHHDIQKAKEVEKIIMRIRGENYREQLLVIEKMRPKQSTFYLKTLKLWYEKQLKGL